MTENVLMQHAQVVVCMLGKLKRIGVSLTIDDFGTGYSSLSYLSHFLIDVLNIDQPFVYDITTHAYNATIVCAVIGMCEGLRCDVIAKGVATPEQAAFLLARHCNRGAGILFGTTGTGCRVHATTRLPGPPDGFRRPPGIPPLLVIAWQRS